MAQNQIPVVGSLENGQRVVCHGDRIYCLNNFGTLFEQSTINIIMLN